MIMNMRDLIPWGRQETAPAPMRNEEQSPFLSLRRDVDRLFDDFFHGSWPSLGRSMSVWSSLEMSETDNELRITAEVPGMGEKDVELLLEDGVLTIRGEKKSE